MQKDLAKVTAFLGIILAFSLIVMALITAQTTHQSVGGSGGTEPPAATAAPESAPAAGVGQEAAPPAPGTTSEQPPASSGQGAVPAAPGAGSAAAPAGLSPPPAPVDSPINPREEKPASQPK